jgi:hypothetical protein
VKCWFIGDALEEFGERRLAVLKGLPAKVLAIELEQIERA